MKKYTILAWMLLATLGCVYAQDATTTSTTGSGDAADYAPAAGDISGSILFGRSNFISVTSSELVPIASSSWQVPGTAPFNNAQDVSGNDVTNMVGGEVRYFLMDNIALKLSGGAILRNTPAQANVPGIIDSGAPNVTWIPAYAAVVADNRMDLNINLGGEYHFGSKYERLYPWAGVTIPFYYARRSEYNPTIVYPSGSSSSGNDIDVLDVGIRSTEIVGFGGQLVGGVDYYLMEGFYIGFEIKPVSVVYAYSTKSPGPGLEQAQADNTTLSFFSQPFFKVGFRF